MLPIFTLAHLKYKCQAGVLTQGLQGSEDIGLKGAIQASR